MKGKLRESLFELFKEELVDYILAGCKEKRHVGIDVSIKLNDTEGTFLTRREHYEDFCKIARQKVVTPRTCDACDNYHFEQMIKSGKTVEYVCHGYLSDLCIPIRDADSGEIMAGLFAGQIRRSERGQKDMTLLRGKITTLASDNNINPSDLWNQFTKTPDFTEGDYNAALKKLEGLAKDIGRRLAYYGRSITAEFCRSVRNDFVAALLGAQDRDGIWNALQDALLKLKDSLDVEVVDTFALNSSVSRSGTFIEKSHTAPATWMVRQLGPPTVSPGDYWLRVGNYGWVHICVTNPTMRSARYLESIHEFAADLARDSDLRLQNLDVLIRIKAQTDRIAEMTSTLAHQAATPLTAIRDLAEKLYDHYDSYMTRERRVSIHNILHYAMDGCTLMLAILDATGEGSALTDNPEVVDVHDEVEAMKERHASMLHEQQMSIRNCIDIDMPKECLRKRVFMHLMYILVDNAIKYSDAGEDITIRAKEVGGYISVSVTSRGVPIRKEELKNVFRKGYRTEAAKEHTARKKLQGSGLGLWIAKLLLDAVGGTIHVASDGWKTTFEFMMPVEVQPTHSERR